MRDANLANVLGALASSILDDVGEALAMSPGGLPQSTALAVISKYPGCSIEELRGPLELSHSGCVRLVDRLVAAQLVERRQTTDARAVALHLTRRGRVAASKTVALRADVLQRFVRVLSPREREQLASIATKLLDAATSTAREAGRTCRLCDYEACVECPFRGRFGQQPGDEGHERSEG
jgi:DNA-binding MarR family transcriptional regulator